MPRSHDGFAMMTRNRVFLLLAAALVMQSGGALAYKYHPYRWQSFPVTWYLDKSGYPGSGMSLEQLQTALTQAFDLWENAKYQGHCSAVRFAFGGTVDANGNIPDEKNVISFVSMASYPGTPDSLGDTVVITDSQNYVVEADIVFPISETRRLSVNPGAEEYDLVGIAAHQIGHFIGIDHSQVPQATMFGVFPAAGDTSWGTPESDDLQAVTDLYPGSCPEGGDSVVADAPSDRQASPDAGPGGAASRWSCRAGRSGDVLGAWVAVVFLCVWFLGRRRHA